MSESRDVPSPAAGRTERKSADELQDDIDQTREELGETIEALAAKTDVKAQAKERIDTAKKELSDKAAHIKQTVGSKTDDLTAKAKDASPESAGAGAQQLRSRVHRRPLPFVAAGAFLLGLAVGVTLRRR
jgi:chromosome segregation ATPase